MKSYELIDHTADIGLRAYGRDLEELFRHAAVGLFEMMTVLEKVQPTTTSTLHLEEVDVEALFVRWLQELLYRFSITRIFYCDFQFTHLTETTLDAVIQGEALDENKHTIHKEVKAVTYHALSVQKTKDGWIGEVIFDI